MRDNSAAILATSQKYLPLSSFAVIHFSTEFCKAQRTDEKLFSFDLFPEISKPFPAIRLIGTHLIGVIKRGLVWKMEQARHLRLVSTTLVVDGRSSAMNTQYNDLAQPRARPSSGLRLVGHRKLLILGFQRKP